MNDELEYNKRIDMPHDEQVDEFGWCMCEAGTGNVSEGCNV